MITYNEDAFDDVTQLRLMVGDTVVDDGPRPGGSNYTDKAMKHWLTSEGSVGLAAALVFETLAAEWASVPIGTRLGPNGETVNSYWFYQLEAKRVRAQYGRPRQPGYQFIAQIARIGDVTG